MSRLLLGETNEILATEMKEFFLLEQYTVQVENNGFSILECLRQEQYDVIALEIALLELDGISVVLDYRASGGNTPILLMSNKHSSNELQWSLDAGADAYLPNPFRLSELAARLRALLRRPTLQSERMITSGLLSIDSESRTVTRNNILVHLHPMEFKLLQFLLSHPNQIFSTHELFERVWQKDFGMTEDTVRTHVRTLRQKIDSEGCASIITTVRGRGYKTETYVAVADCAQWGFKVSSS